MIKNNASVDNLQILISEGRKILLKKPNGEYLIEVRYNHNDIDGTKKWRIILDDLEFLVEEVIINKSSRTLSTYNENMGGFKHHIVIYAQEVLFNKLTANIN